MLEDILLVAAEWVILGDGFGEILECDGESLLEGGGLAVASLLKSSISWFGLKSSVSWLGRSIGFLSLIYWSSILLYSRGRVLLGRCSVSILSLSARLQNSQINQKVVSGVSLVEPGEQKLGRDDCCEANVYVVSVVTRYCRVLVKRSSETVPVRHLPWVEDEWKECGVSSGGLLILWSFSRLLDDQGKGAGGQKEKVKQVLHHSNYLNKNK